MAHDQAKSQTDRQAQVESASAVPPGSCAVRLGRTASAFRILYVKLKSAATHLAARKDPIPSYPTQRKPLVKIVPWRQRPRSPLNPPKSVSGDRLSTCEIARNRANSWVSQDSKRETGLGGWGERIRTSELQKQRPSNSMHTPAPSPASRLAMQCPRPLAPAPRIRAKGPAAPRRAGGGGAPTGASGKRIHGAIWRIGEAGAALPRSRMDTGRTGGVIGGSECGP